MLTEEILASVPFSLRVFFKHTLLHVFLLGVLHKKIRHTEISSEIEVNIKQ
jgi:hypothetical protein